MKLDNYYALMGAIATTIGLIVGAVLAFYMSVLLLRDIF